MTSETKLLNFFVLIPIIICFSIFPIVELYFGIKYDNTFLCESSVGITLTTWLIVKGTVSIISVFIIVLSYASDKDSLIYFISYLYVILYKIFLLGWLITGSIIFWKDCKNLKENDLYIRLFIFFTTKYQILKISKGKL